MFYTYAQIEPLLSATGKTILGNTTNYTTFSEQTEIQIAELCGTFTTTPAWMKMPYVWILEYLISIKTAGASPDQLQRTTANYNTAIKFLSKKNIGTNTVVPSSTGNMEGLYTDEVLRPIQSAFVQCVV